VLVRAATYAALFIGLVLVFLPVRVLSWSGISQPAALGMPQVGGLAVTHLFVLWYEEPTLRRTFGQEYEAYGRRVRRWLPRLSSGES